MASFAVTTVNDCIFRQNYWFPYLPQVRPLVWIAVTIGNSIPSLRIFIIWKVAGWQQYTRRPPRMRMQNGPPFIINLSSPGGGLQGEVFQKFSDIYTPTPKTAPDQGMINRYLPSWETPRRWRARACPSDPRLGGGGWGVVSWPRTLRHGESNTPQKAKKYITCGTSPTHAAPQKICLGPGMCWDDAYVKIHRMAP